LDRELEGSLRRLETDRIDLVLAHRWDPAASVEEVLRIFERWVASGKVLALGVSNWPAWRVAQAMELSRRNGWPTVVVSSPKYNLRERGVELEHAACALHYGIALVPYQPFGGGLLTGKYRAGETPPPGSRAAEKAAWLRMPDAAAFERLETAAALAAEASMQMAQYALAWVLSRPGVASVVVGCRSVEQLEQLIAAAGMPFPEEHSARIDALFPPPKPTGEQVLRRRDGEWCLGDLELEGR
jgi:aryl-alcohol dehydrogenase-like predicted oxidoreductase